MAYYGSPNFSVKVTSASGTTALHNLSNYVDTVNGLSIEALTAESHAFGDSWREHMYTGMRQMADITLSGFYEDTAASGPWFLLGDVALVGAQRTFEFDFGASDILATTALIVTAMRQPTRNELTRFEITIRPSGAPTTAT